MDCPICGEKMDVIMADNHEVLYQHESCHTYVEQNNGKITAKYIMIEIDLMKKGAD
jgi:hypothetical protein